MKKTTATKGAKDAELFDFPSLELSSVDSMSVSDGIGPHDEGQGLQSRTENLLDMTANSAGQSHRPMPKHNITSPSNRLGSMPLPPSSPEEILAAVVSLKANAMARRPDPVSKSRSAAAAGASVARDTRCNNFSTPTTLNFTLREKLRKLAAAQRQARLRKQADAKEQQRNQHGPRNGTTGNRNMDVEESNSVTEDYDYGPHPVWSSRARFRRNRDIPFDEPVHNDAPSNRRKRQTHYISTRGAVTLVPIKRQTNSIKLHIYDLIAQDTLMQLPWGCVCEIGKCFNEVNSALHELGTGAYHVGVEVNGIEYAYGATSAPGKSGVFSCIPMLSPGYQYRTTIDFGERPLVRKDWVSVKKGKSGKPSTVFRQTEKFVDGREIIKEMTPEYMGIDYDILRKNCCTFARDACIRLGVKEEEIPSWFRNLAESGAMTQDLALATVGPIAKVLSACEGDSFDERTECEAGFEIITRRNEANTMDIVIVVDAAPVAAATPAPSSNMENPVQIPHFGVRRTVTWTY